MKKLIQCVPSNLNTEEIEEHINSIIQSGFNGVFLQWYDDNINKIIHQINYCKNNNIYIDFIHLNYENTNHLWQNTILTNQTINTYLDKLYVCKQHNINTVVLHLSSKETAPPLNKTGVSNFSKIIKTAEELNIKVALENTKTTGRFEYLINNIKSQNIGLCFDSGHHHCFYKDSINWSILHNKIFTIHLHDNNKNKDEHLMPFNGNINWSKLTKNLQAANYQGNIVFEIHNKNYPKLSISQFYHQLYKSALKTHKLFITDTY